MLTSCLNRFLSGSDSFRDIDNQTTFFNLRRITWDTMKEKFTAFSNLTSNVYSNQEMREIEVLEGYWTQETLALSEWHLSLCSWEERWMFLQDMIVYGLSSWLVSISVVFDEEHGMKRGGSVTISNWRKTCSVGEELCGRKYALVVV